MKNKKLTPKPLLREIKELKNHLESLENYCRDRMRRHKKLDIGNGTYDPVQYRCFQIMLHTSFIREKLNMHKSFEGSDGRGKKYCEFDDGSKMNCYDGEEVVQ